MTETNLRVIEGDRGKLPSDAPFSEFCRAAVVAVTGGEDESWFHFGEKLNRSNFACSSLGNRISFLSQWTRDNLPSWAIDQKPSQRLAVIDSRLHSAIEGWKGQCVLLTGPTGVGKTTAAVHLLLEFWELSIRRAVTLHAAQRQQKSIPLAHWIKSTNLERARREHPLGQGESQVVTDAINADFLFIDDLGQEPNRGEAVLFDVLDARYERRPPTIVTSGLTVAELGNRYGNHLLRRLTDHARGCRLGEVLA